MSLADWKRSGILLSGQCRTIRSARGIGRPRVKAPELLAQDGFIVSALVSPGCRGVREHLVERRQREIRRVMTGKAADLLGALPGRAHDQTRVGVMVAVGTAVRPAPVPAGEPAPALLLRR